MASPEIEDYETRLWTLLNQIDQELMTLLPQLADKADSSDLVDSTSQVSGFKGSQRMGQLMELRKTVTDSLSAIPHMDAVPVAMGVDAIGRELGESILDEP